MRSNRELVELAIKNYENLPQIQLGGGQSEQGTDQDVSLATPNRLTYALGWIVANAIVQARYADSGIDAVPIFHPEHGWDRFLLTRRLTATLFAEEPADSFGLLMLDGEDAPRITKPSGAERLTLGRKLREDPDAALEETVGLFKRIPVPSDKKMGVKWKERRVHYPRLYHAVTELLVENPGLAGAREIFVDDQPVDGAYHPLYLHGVALHPTMVYDWFLVQYGERAVFFRTHGGQTVYETDRGGWATVKRQLSQEESTDAVKERIARWLRIGGRAPDRQTID